jgi:hypothetical protein
MKSKGYRNPSNKSQETPEFWKSPRGIFPPWHMIHICKEPVEGHGTRASSYGNIQGSSRNTMRRKKALKRLRKAENRDSRAIPSPAGETGKR